MFWSIPVFFHVSFRNITREVLTRNCSSPCQISTRTEIALHPTHFFSAKTPIVAAVRQEIQMFEIHITLFRFFTRQASRHHHSKAVLTKSSCSCHLLQLPGRCTVVASDSQESQIENRQTRRYQAYCLFDFCSFAFWSLLQEIRGLF